MADGALSKSKTEHSCPERISGGANPHPHPNHRTVRQHAGVGSELGRPGEDRAPDKLVGTQVVLDHHKLETAVLRADLEIEGDAPLASAPVLEPQRALPRRHRSSR